MSPSVASVWFFLRFFPLSLILRNLIILCLCVNLFMWIYPIWSSCSFLNLYVHAFCNFETFAVMIFLNIISILRFFFWNSNDTNIIMLCYAEFPKSTIVIQYFPFPLLFSLFSIILSSISLICSSDSSILVLITSSGFHISVTAVFILAWLVFRSFISVVRDSLVSSMLFSSSAK